MKIFIWLQDIKDLYIGLELYFFNIQCIASKIK